MPKNNKVSIPSFQYIDCEQNIWTAKRYNSKDYIAMWTSEKGNYISYSDNKIHCDYATIDVVEAFLNFIN